MENTESSGISREEPAGAGKGGMPDSSLPSGLQNTDEPSVPGTAGLPDGFYGSASSGEFRDGSADGGYSGDDIGAPGSISSLEPGSGLDPDIGIAPGAGSAPDDFPGSETDSASGIASGSLQSGENGADGAAAASDGDTGAESSDDSGSDADSGDDDGDDDDDDDEDDDDNGSAAPEAGDDSSDPDTAADFVPEKQTAEQVTGGKPPKFNRAFVLKIIFGIVLVVCLALFFVPGIGKKNDLKKASERAQALDRDLPDYESMAAENGRDGKSPDAEKSVESAPDDAGDSGSSEVAPEFKYDAAADARKPAVVYSGPGSSGGYSRPDTRRDALQTSVSGIKGLSSSRSFSPSDSSSQPAQGSGVTTNLNDGSASGIPRPDSSYSAPGSDARTDILRQLAATQNRNSYETSNDQGGKSKFHTAGSGNAGSSSWIPENSIWDGTIFEAVLLSAINTDIPGEINARISKNVYSSQNGKYLLIPQNSVLIGSYNSSISYSQSRVQIGWNTIIRPDGLRIDLGNFNATDPQGAAGLKGKINDHPFQYIKAIGLMSVFNIISTEFQNSGASSTNQYVQNVMANSQEVANTLGQKLIDRAMDVQPTLTIKSGTIIRVFANETLTIDPYPDYPVTEPYRRTW